MNSQEKAEIEFQKARECFKEAKTHFTPTAKKHIIGLSILAIVGLVFIFGLPHGSATEDAETLRQQALELRNKARREDCAKIATRITACYTGDDGACLKMHESLAWFNREYGESAELSCPNEEMSFGEGNAK